MCVACQRNSYDCFNFWFVSMFYFHFFYPNHFFSRTRFVWFSSSDVGDSIPLILISLVSFIFNVVFSMLPEQKATAGHAWSFSPYLVSNSEGPTALGGTLRTLPS